MRLLTSFLFITLLSCLFFACNDNGTDPNDNGNLSAHIASISYEMVTAHKSYYDPSASEDSYAYLYGLKLTLTLDDSKQRNSISKISMSSGDYHCEFLKQELDGAYVDSVGGYIFDFISVAEGSHPHSLIWDVKLFGLSGDSSNAYKLVTNFDNCIFTHYCASDWTGGSTLEMSLRNLYTDLGANAVAETHYLNQDSIETGFSSSPIKNNKWIADNAPADAVSFFYIINDKYNGIKRKFISKPYSLNERLPDNTERIEGIISPTWITYVEDIDKMLVMSRDKTQLSLLNPKTDDVIWTKQLSSQAQTFVYSPGHETIYLGYANGIVNSINPADGSEKELFNLYSSPGHIIILHDSLIIIPAYYADSYSIYDLNTKLLYQRSASFGYTSIYGSAYNPQNGRMYFRGWDYLFNFNFNTVTGELADKKLTYLYNITQANVVMFFNYDLQKIFLGEGVVYDIPANPSSGLIKYKEINPFCDLTYINDMQIATVVPEYWINNQKQPASISIYDLSNYNLLGYKSGLTGTPKKIYAEGNYLKVYYTDDNANLMVRKYAVTDILNSSSNRINNKKQYKMKKL